MKFWDWVKVALVLIGIVTVVNAVYVFFVCAFNEEINFWDRFSELMIIEGLAMTGMAVLIAAIVSFFKTMNKGLKKEKENESK